MPRHVAPRRATPVSAPSTAPKRPGTAPALAHFFWHSRDCNTRSVFLWPRNASTLRVRHRRSMPTNHLDEALRRMCGGALPQVKQDFENAFVYVYFRYIEYKLNKPWEHHENGERCRVRFKWDGKNLMVPGFFVKDHGGTQEKALRSCAAHVWNKPEVQVLLSEETAPPPQQRVTWA